MRVLTMVLGALLLVFGALGVVSLLAVGPRNVGPIVLAFVVACAGGALFRWGSRRR